ncbi:hypothetical protein [Phaeobacter sp. HF9A]|uniref:hypothetical protein n=1 Tax=Phaeobacter sp. HF9A TaxID=2721561 RepID=UPI0014316FF4|nr:hypothetical protein [Phaeobacter sp. HF9A]NIZ13900.1 hypothetical protein [Phaeobacter sp. HF9A]
MIAVITRYYPLREMYDEVLERTENFARDDNKERVGCYETRLFASRTTGEIISVSLWQSKDVFDTYIDGLIQGDNLLQFQETFMRREIDTQIYDAVDTGVAGHLPENTAHARAASE